MEWRSHWSSFPELRRQNQTTIVLWHSFPTLNCSWYCKMLNIHFKRAVKVIKTETNTAALKCHHFYCFPFFSLHDNPSYYRNTMVYSIAAASFWFEAPNIKLHQASGTHQNKTNFHGNWSLHIIMQHFSWRDITVTNLHKKWSNLHDDLNSSITTCH